MKFKWKKLMKIRKRKMDENFRYYNDKECELAQNHYLEETYFGEYTYPLYEIRDIICKHFNIPIPKMTFTNRGYRFAGRCKKRRFNDIFEIQLRNSESGKNVGTLIHEIAHYWGHGHDWEFKKAQTRILRFVEDNIIAPPSWDIGWQEKLAKKYLSAYGEDIENLEQFAKREEIDPELLLDLIIKN